MDGEDAINLPSECWEAENRLMYIELPQLETLATGCRIWMEEVQKGLMNEVGVILDLDGRSNALGSSL